MTIKKYDLESQLKSLGIELESLTKQIEARAKEGMGLLQQQIYGKIVEKATEKLKSTRSTYIENLGMMNDSDNLWIVYLKQDAAWIEQGQEAGERIDQILNGGKPAKVSKSGNKYKTIPFKHNKSPQQTSRAQMQIQNVVKSELKKRGLDKTIMVDGRPKLGKAASLKNELAGPGMPVSRFNKPILAGLNIYQREHKTAGGKTLIKRDVMTFRTISESQKGSGLWFYKEMKGAHIFDEIEKEVDDMWSKMLESIVGQVKIEVKE